MGFPFEIGMPGESLVKNVSEVAGPSALATAFWPGGAATPQAEHPLGMLRTIALASLGNRLAGSPIAL